MRGQKRVEDARERAYARASIKKIHSQCMSVLNGISASGEFGLLPSPLWGGVGGGGPSLGRDSNITARPPPRALTRADPPHKGEGRTECAVLNCFQRNVLYDRGQISIHGVKSGCFWTYIC